MSNQDEFKAGFEEGYKSIKGDMVLVPLCPLAPLSPHFPSKALISLS